MMSCGQRSSRSTALVARAAPTRSSAAAEVDREPIGPGSPLRVCQGHSREEYQVVARRVSWERLRGAPRREIERHTGTVTAARLVRAGRNCAVALVLTTPSGTVFAKGLHRSSPRLWT